MYLYKINFEHQLKINGGTRKQYYQNVRHLQFDWILQNILGNLSIFYLHFMKDIHILNFIMKVIRKLVVYLYITEGLKSTFRKREKNMR